MTTSDKTLSTQLLSLPIDTEGKVSLWLTYKGEKPVSTIRFNKELEDPMRNTQIVSWLKDAGLVSTPDSQSTVFAFVSKDQTLAEKASSLMWSEEANDLLKKGELFGYPTEATEYFASKKDIRIIVPSNFPHYWAAYVRYCVRPSHEMEDSLTGKKWADIIRSDVPELAAQFEKELESTEIR